MVGLLERVVNMLLARVFDEYPPTVPSLRSLPSGLHLLDKPVLDQPAQHLQCHDK